MLPRAAVGALCALSVLAPNEARGDSGGGLPSIDFGVVCTPGDIFRACASVSAWNEFDPITSEYFLYVQIANMQGRPGFESEPYGLGDWRLTNLLVENCGTDEDYGPESCTDWGGLNDRLDTFSTGTSNPSPIEFRISGEGPYWSVGYDFFSDDAAALWGCDEPQDPLASGERTCDEPFLFRISLGLGGSFALTEHTELVLEFTSDYEVGRADTGCYTGEEPAPFLLTHGPCVPVPEPNSLLLLASGGLALAYIRRSRRS